MEDTDNIQEVAQSRNDEFPTISKKELELAVEDYDKKKQRFLVSPTKQQLLGRGTVFCMVLNRTIGSGIFTTPPKVLAGVGSVGGSLMIWSSTGLIVLCGVLCWLELGLSIPFRWVTDHNGITRRVATPRSGGEKNFIEFIFRKPRLFITSVYGIFFILLGNISGNAVAFGIYVMIAAGRDPIYDQENGYEKKPVIGLAIGVLTFCAGMHFFTRRGGIYVNNAFAVVKISMVLALTILGFVHWGKKYLHSSGINESPLHNSTFAAGQLIPNITSPEVNIAASINLDPHFSFRGGSSSVANYVDSFLFVLFSYTGFEQPFYVLSEVERPRKVFPTYTLLGMLVTTVLYTLVNLSYFCVVPKEAYTSTSLNSIDMAGLFMHYLFDKSYSPQVARRVMAGLTAISIFGNIVVMTFTSARVKQEIAKEGILPYSLFFATGHTTPWAKFQAWRRRDTTSTGNPQAGHIDLENHLEQTPMAALFLHWVTSILLIAVTSMLKPVTAYVFLVSLYSYVNCAVVGFLVSGGLMYLKLDSFFRGERGRNWANLADFVPWLSPLHAIIYFAATGFFLFATFTPPPAGSTYVKSVQGYQWYLLPAIGLSSLLWGVLWWCGIEWRQWISRTVLVVARLAYVEQDADGNYVQKAEIVEHWWRPNVNPNRGIRPWGSGDGDIELSRPP